MKKVFRYLRSMRFGLLLLVLIAALSVVGTVSHDRMYQAAVARELKKQLEPIHKQLDELSAQNEELRRQNEQLQKQLAQS